MISKYQVVIQMSAKKFELQLGAIKPLSDLLAYVSC